MLGRAAFLALTTMAAIGLAASSLAADKNVVVFDADELDDKIRGGMLAQVLGNLNGLPHEFKYIDEPGNVLTYTPSLSKGAFTDDDTDIEWVYLTEILRSGVIELPPERIGALWKRHINRRIFCANLYARQLMDLGIQPPWTGNVGLNPWSEFNISGQFLCESFGLIAPAMPRTAAQLGLNYTRVAINGEPAQSTQLFTTMISMAFVETDLDRLLDAGLTAVDPKSRVAEVVRETRAIYRAHPDDWRAARSEIKDRWQSHGGSIRDRNGYELNTACTIAALLYGKKDFVETLRLAFNLGWDCDNNAATAGTIVGVIKGRRWMDAQGWDIVDAYRNSTRDDMPMDETLTGLQEKLVACARLVIQDRKGEVIDNDGRRVYQIRTELPGNVQSLATTEEQIEALRESFLPGLAEGIAGPGPVRARAAYVALCLNEGSRLERQSPEKWAAAIAELRKYPSLVRQLFELPEPQGDAIRDRALRAGLKPPKG
jgi:ADP-ribosylglycohydrolase